MSISSWLSANTFYQPYQDHARFFEGLKTSERKAIVYLQIKALPTVRKIVAGYGLSPELSEEILNDATLIFLRKIHTEAYQFAGNNPTTYCIEIAKKLALLATRKRQFPNENLENLSDLGDPDTAAWLAQRETADVVRQLLAQLGSPCDKLIRLQYIEGYSDEEVVRQGWTAYSTVASLKVKRSDCMKKLTELAQLWKKKETI